MWPSVAFVKNAELSELRFGTSRSPPNESTNQSLSRPTKLLESTSQFFYVLSALQGMI